MKWPNVCKKRRYARIKTTIGENIYGVGQVRRTSLGNREGANATIQERERALDSQGLLSNTNFLVLHYQSHMAVSSHRAVSANWEQPQPQKNRARTFHVACFTTTNSVQPLTHLSCRRVGDTFSTPRGRFSYIYFFFFFIYLFYLPLGPPAEAPIWVSFTCHLPLSLSGLPPCCVGCDLVVWLVPSPLPVD